MIGSLPIIFQWNIDQIFCVELFNGLTKIVSLRRDSPVYGTVIEVIVEQISVYSQTV